MMPHTSWLDFKVDLTYSLLWLATFLIEEKLTPIAANRQ